MAFLAESDLRAVAEAIRKAEARTSGEIVTVVAERAEGYLWLPFAVPALVALILPGGAAPFAGIVAAGDLFFLQIVTFAVLFAALLVPRVRALIVPGPLKRAAARRRAREQFFQRGLHLTEGRTGILIFVSVAERYVEILADEGIDRKVAPDAWQEIVNAFIARVRQRQVAQGFIAAIEQVGAILATHCPPHVAKNPNELPDRLFVI